ncbi:serine/threonine protein kinase [Azoarcus olearius]|uniref:Serine/threonine protein kinase n=1 Tax=Azoarcus sp. (strain BH72) TaxID=418699 RepID=A1K4W8_AZOSB|nr:serine/threonine protein kinase [Azoarcus olearius]CAL93873.1 putative serine/threonine protein kinase [Azoarcus olearius]
MADRVGRFEIRGELGRGAQSVVYRAFDPQLEREVAVKTLHFTEHKPGQNETLLAEARIVSPLRHPGIVPIFEAGEADGDVYLVFEYVRGESLAAHMQREGALPPVRAGEILVQILAAVGQAHAEGIIHRDLKPTNVLMDESGAVRVMDFGIACRTAGKGGQAGFAGTPSYMAPEYITTREVSERIDVFAAGVIFIELLTGRRLFAGDDVDQVMQRIVARQVVLPTDLSLDERVAGIALRAVARDPAERFESAAAFRQALEAWLQPDEAVQSAEARQSTVDFLLRRMRHKSDFPALSESVSAINRIASSESESVSKLSVSILRDFSLTNKILRLVNSVAYRQAGGGSISTVSRAVIVLGFDTVRNIAITVLLFEHLQNKANASQLKEDFLRANLAGILARDIASKARTRDLEQSFICAIFHNLGRLLTQFYFPEESEEIRRMMAQKSCTEEVAALRVLGLSFEDLGIGIARSWGFPTLIVDSMHKLPAGKVRKPATQEDRLRVVSALSNEISTAIATLSPEERAKEMQRIAARFAEAQPLDDTELKDAIKHAIEEITEFARIIRINLGQTHFGQQLRRYSGGETGGEGGGSDGSMGSAVLEQNRSPALETGNFGEEGRKAADAQAVLTAGIQDISNTLVEEFKLNDILRIILETMYRAMGFRRVLLCIRDARSNTMQGRFGFGPEVTELAKQFRFTLSFTPDIFHAATSKGVDILISDVDDAKIAERIPAWFRKGVTAKTFVLFPLTIKNAPVALIYADKEHAGEIEITEKELSLLRTLRNQAVLAIKQST